MGELIVIVYQSLGQSTFSYISSETTGPIKLKFHMETPLDAGTKVCSNGPGPKWSPCPYITVYRCQGAYRFKTAFPEPYPLQRRSLSAKTSLAIDSDIKR